MCNHMKLSIVAIIILSTAMTMQSGCHRSAEPIYIWHNGSKHILEENNGQHGYVQEGEDPSGKDDKFIPLSDFEINTSEEREMIDRAKMAADKRIWHNNEWRIYEWSDASAAQGHKDVPVVNGRVRSYLRDGKFITFPTTAELALSDAKKAVA